MATAGVLPLVINGQDYFPDKTFDVKSPSTDQVIHKCGAASVADAARAVDAAADALKSWRKTTPYERQDIFLKAAEVMEGRRDDLIKHMTDETGATRGWVDFNISRTIDLLKDTAGRIPTMEGSFPPTVDRNRSAIVMHEPYGVVLSIAPWNAPYILGTRSIAYPIAMGNTVVFKASELCPKTLRAIVDVFHQAGLPNGVLNMIAHAPADAAAVTSSLITNPHVKKINFTGSTNVGRIIAKQAGEHLKPVVLELGGKAPAIVWEDADLDLAAKQCATGSFLHSGQICMSTERILVHKAVSDAFQQKFAAAVANMFPVDGDAPILINTAAAQKNKQLVSNATERGASTLYGDIHAQESSHNRLRPVILSGVTSEMDIYKTEAFGPTVSVIEIESEEEAIRIANDTEYGLTSAIFTEDLRRGLRFAAELETGAVHINSMSVHDETSLPHGGTKASGYGRFNGSIGLAEWTRTKNITFEK
ncbi:Vanillin dehydrogenase [Metarhizium anisopliae]|nr:Vanillin dehydrogenase [Metarhizium anisopliae]